MFAFGQPQRSLGAEDERRTVPGGEIRWKPVVAGLLRSQLERDGFDSEFAVELTEIQVPEQHVALRAGERVPCGGSGLADVHTVARRHPWA